MDMRRYTNVTYQLSKEDHKKADIEYDNMKSD
jgi:hypothetical protein